MLDRARGKLERLNPDEILQFERLHRIAIAEVAEARLRRPSDPLTGHLEVTVVRGHAALYGRGRHGTTLREWLSRRLWHLIYDMRSSVAVCVVLLLVPALVGFVWAEIDPGRAGGIVPGVFAAVTRPRPNGAGLGLAYSVRSEFATSIFTHNITIAFLAFAGGMTAGTLTAASLLYNGITLGVAAGLAFGAGDGGTLVSLVAPHGLLELSCIVVAGASGLKVAQAFINPGNMRRAHALSIVAPAAVEVALGAGLFLVLAGLIEGFVTPSGLSAWAAVAFGSTVAGSFWALVVLRGRRGRALDPAPTL